jgi:hypothetical protein
MYTISAFKFLELLARKKLLELGIDSNRLPLKRSIEILKENKIIAENDFNSFIYVWQLRNKATHSNEEFSRQEANYVSNIVREITPKLLTREERNRTFAKDVYEALVSSTGLFPRHHVEYDSSKDEGYDIKASGPNFEYYIEVKEVVSEESINNAIRQLGKFQGDNIRKIIVLPYRGRDYQINEDSIKILYFNPIKRMFENKEELHEWIFGN